MRPARPDGANLRMREQSWVLREDTWYTEALRIVSPGSRHSVLLLWTPGFRELLLWYVNLEDPLVRTPIGLDYLDQLLDIEIAEARRNHTNVQGKVEEESHRMVLSRDDYNAIINDDSKTIAEDIVWERASSSPAREFRIDIDSSEGYPIFVKGWFNPYSGKLSYAIIHRSVGRIYGLDLGTDHLSNARNYVPVDREIARNYRPLRQVIDHPVRRIGDHCCILDVRSSDGVQGGVESGDSRSGAALAVGHEPAAGIATGTGLSRATVRRYIDAVGGGGPGP